MGHAGDVEAGHKDNVLTLMHKVRHSNVPIAQGFDLNYYLVLTNPIFGNT